MRELEQVPERKESKDQVTAEIGGWDKK